jgi:hypothetical protein
MGLLTRAEREGRMPGPQSALVVMDRAAKATVRIIERTVVPKLAAASPKRTGRLSRSWRAKRRGKQGADVSIGPRGGKSRGDEKGAFYGHFVTKGTGIYGPKGQPIRRKNGQPFVITAGDGTVIRTDEIKGQRPNPFVAPVAAWADRQAVEVAEEQLAEAARTITERNL